VLRAALLGAAAFGVPGAVPVSPTGDSTEDRNELSVQAAVAQADVQRRLDELDEAAPAGERLRIVFGGDFRAVPLYTPPARGPAEIDTSFASSTSLQGGDPSAVVRWFQRLTRVREGARRLGDALLYADALGGADTLRLVVGQLPAGSDRWLGLPFADGAAPAGRVSFVAYLPEGPVAGTLAGLLFEEFTEVLPAAAKTTGLALHYDQPNASPPQAIALAVPPRLAPDETWTLARLRAAVESMLELAKLRMVDLDALQEAGHFLPATYLGLNMKGVTVATDFLAGRGLPLS